MRVLQLAISETAGMPYRLGRALRSAGVECDVVTLRSEFFPCVHPGHHVNPNWGTLRQLIDSTDVVHVHALSTTYQLFCRDLADKPVLIHLHGAPDRDNDIAPPRPHVVATPDLLAQYPRAVFIPNLALSHELAPSEPVAGGPVRVFKSPSLHDKSRSFFCRIMESITRRLGPRVQFVTPELMPHPELCQLRSTCHISLDHVDGYYGLESLESLAQGLIAVNGVTEANLRCLVETVGAAPPFAIARDTTGAATMLVRLLREAIEDPARFEARRAVGRRFIAQHWRTETLVQYWIGAYNAVLAGRWPRPITREVQQVLQ